jgi:DNA-binding response OmpR family regulator
MTSVLMVETDAALISAVGRVLSRHQVEVCAVDRIERARELSREREFSLLLIDSNLVSARDLQAFAGTKIVVTASFLEREPSERFSERARVLQKPFTSAELSQILSDELGLALGQESLLDLLSRAHVSKNSLSLQIGSGELVLKDGELVHAALGEMWGEMALIEILARGGAVTLSPNLPNARSMARAFEPLLLDALCAVEKRDDESRESARRGRKVVLRSLRGGAR